MSEQNLKQARAAYEQFTDFVTKTIGAWMGALPSNPMAAVVKDVEGRALEFAMENAEQFAQDRMQAFITQTQQLFSVIEEALQKSERGAMGASMGAMPSNLMTAGFKDVQDRVVEITKKNAESGFALVEKVAKAQNFQECKRRCRFADR